MIEIPATAEEAQARARALREAGLEHKRLTAHHRRETRRTFRELSAFLNVCRSYGIEVDVALTLDPDPEA